MEYVYSAMLLHSAGKKIDEKSVTDIVKAAGLNVDSSRVKALISALKDVNIEEAIKNAAVVQAVAAPAAATVAPAASSAESAKEEKKEDKKTEEEAAQGLSSLFG